MRRALQRERARAWRMVCGLLLALGCSDQAQPVTPMLSPEQRLGYYHERAKVIAGELAQLGFPLRVRDVTLTLGERQRDLENFVESALHDSSSSGVYAAYATLRRALGLKGGRDESALRWGAIPAELAATAAYYDPVGQAVVFRRSRLAAQLPDVDFLVAHELAHVYQDQAQGGLDAFGAINSRSFDRSRAAHAMVEGQASLIARALLLRRRNIDLVELDLSLEDDTLTQLLSGEGGGIIYTSGMAFLLQQYRARGWPGVLDAYRHPPISTEQLLHPAKYGKDVPNVVSLPMWPDPTDRVDFLASEVFGELMLVGALSECLGQKQDEISFAARDRAQLASLGWDGDRFHAYSLGDDRRAAMWRSVWDDDASAEEFLKAFNAALDATEAPREMLSVERRGNVIDVAFSEDPEQLPKLARALHDHPRYFRLDPADAATTRAAEAEYRRRQAARPRIDGRYWVYPSSGVNVPLLEGWKLALRAGGQVLVNEESDDELQVITVQRWQDLLKGNLTEFLKELEGHTRALPFPIPALNRTIRKIAGIDVGVLDARVGEKYPFRMRLWALPREGHFFVISGIASDETEGEAERVLQDIERGITLQPRAPI